MLNASGTADVPASYARYFRMTVDLVPRPKGVRLPEKGAMKALRELASDMECRGYNPEQYVRWPRDTMMDGGGHWHEVILLLAQAAKSAGIKTRLQISGLEFVFQARESATDDWETMGPSAPAPRGAIERTD